MYVWVLWLGGVEDGEDDDLDGWECEIWGVDDALRMDWVDEKKGELRL